MKKRKIIVMMYSATTIKIFFIEIFYTKNEIKNEIQ